MSSIVFVLLMVLVFSISKNIVLDGFSVIEANQTENNVKRIKEAINEKIKNLVTKSSDWAIWDDMYKFAQDGNQAFIETNLNVVSFDNLKIDHMLIADRSGDIKFQLSFDYVDKNQLVLSDKIKNRFKPGGELLAKVDKDTPIAGLMWNDDQPIFFVSRPIYTSKHDGQAQGLLFFGVNVDKDLIKELANTIKFPLFIEPVTSGMKDAVELKMRNLNERETEAEFVIEAFNHESGLLVRTVFHRDVYQQALKTERYLIVFFGVLGFIFISILLFVIDRFVLRRLEKLSSGVKEITKEMNYSGNIVIDGNDEFAQTAEEINVMQRSLSAYQQQLVEHLHEYEEIKIRFELALGVGKIGVWEWDIKANTLLWDNQMCAIYGIDLNNFPGAYQAWESAIHPEDKSSTIEALQQGVKEIKEYNTEFRIIWPDQSIHHIKAYGMLIKDKEGRPVKMIGVNLDVTVERKREEEIQRLNAFQQEILNNAGSSVIATTTEGVITLFNSAAEKMLGYKASEMINIMTPAAFHDPQEVIARAQEFSKELNEEVTPGFDTFVIKSRKGMPNTYEWTYIRKDGTRLTVLLTVTALKDAKNNIFGYIGVGTDITESQRAKEEIYRKNIELEIANKKAMTAVESKSKFLANMSHEIRTPMNAILGFGNILGKTQLDSKQREYLDLISNSGELLLGIINDILDISKLESGKIKFESIDCDLNKMIFDVMNMIVTRIKNKPYDTYVDFHEDIPMYVKTDPLRLKQVLINLLGNSVKFTTQGEIGVIVEKLSETDSEMELKFTIKDTGIGIAKENQSRLFQSFSQADESTTRIYGGTGLGLAISKSIVEALGGKIWLESSEGRGTCFYFTLKVGKSAKKVEALAETDGVRAFKNKTVFIVDDNQTSQRIIGQCCRTLNLQIMGYSSSPQEALLKLERMNQTRGIVPDIILSDIMMEGMSGFEMVRQIKANDQYKKTTFIAITADLNAEQDHDPTRSIFNAYVTKPISLERIVSALRSLTSTSVSPQDRQPVDLRKPCTGIKILVAEDVLANQLLIKEYFKILGCEADVVSNGQEAVDRLRTAHDYQLCFMDLQMPVMDGISAVKMIRAEISKDFPVIALSAAVMKEDQREAFAAGMTDFLMKPIDLEKLKAKILQYGRIV